MTSRDPSGDPVVLIVEDEPDVAETYELWLAGSYDVRCAYSGSAALDVLDDLEGAVDVVLLDRMMPGLSGDEVLERIRDAGYDCRVAMVTAVDPDFDIIAMGFDAYVTKPPMREQLRDVIADLLDRREVTETLREYRSLVSKRAALRVEKSDAELAESDEFARLETRIDELRAEVDVANEHLLNDTAFVSLLRDLADGGDERDE